MANLRAFFLRLVRSGLPDLVGNCMFVLILLVAIAAASTAGHENAAQMVYQNDFEPRIEWSYYTLDGMLRPLATRHENNNTFLASSGPWWIDPNHAPPGAGYLSLIAFAHHGSWGFYMNVDGSYQIDRHSGRPPLRKPTELGRFAYTSPIGGVSPLDLRAARISFKIRSQTELPDGVDLHLWFQSVNASSGKFVNYLLRRKIPTNDAWQQHTLVLSSDDNDWICLGSNANRTETYGCAASVAEALRNFDVDLGFVLFLGENKRPRTGEYHFDEISLQLAPVAEMH